MKLHIGSGSVYLRDWLNVDLPDEHTFLTSERPDLLEGLATDESDYYGRHKDKTPETLRSGPLNQQCVCDAYGSFFFIPARRGSVEEILTRQCFEHLSISEANRALIEMKSVLSIGGILRIDVPDHEQTLSKLIETGDKFYIRHLLGPRRHDHGFHMMSYSRERLKELVEGHGFEFVCEEENVHFFPAFCMRFRRA